ncbi:anti-sigma factor [Verrucosispora sp. WMMC514]|uniref:anti-sigma factor n=1 Tax=Verrucosispora sp. WMMC514 TaxID=3015156 RepID=UPI00248A9F7D|nr:anti-sigma factor [Verrucosispora sp. WMMC514]WBB91239.1 anti-sigma factor [Verrucosispora sp. WMMC514]
MSTAPQTDGGADDQLVDLLTGHLDRHARRTPGRKKAAAQSADPALLAAVATELRAETTWASGPPPALRDSILSRVRAHAAEQPVAEPVPEPRSAPEPRAVPEAVPAPEPPAATGPPTGGAATPVAPADPGPRWWQPAWWRPRMGRLTWALPAAALGAAVFTAGVLAVDRMLDPQPHADVYAAAGTDLAPAARGKVSVVDTPSGASIVLEPVGLPAAAPGSYYAAWLKGPRGTVPIGSFHERRSGVPIELWSGVDIADYTTFSVTLQTEGAPPTPSGLVVLTAALDS